MSEAPPDAPRASLPRAVVALGVVSLLTDVAADMATPYLPLFLTRTLHAPTAFVGLVEGLADATSALMKYVAGALSDRSAKKKPWVLAGYTLANAARPFLSIATAPWHALLVRVVDRVGKGVRTAPRDAIIARAATPESRAYAFGFHRGMDNLGAVFGPLLAAAILAWRDDLRTVFALTAVPGLLSVLTVAFALREPAAPPPATTTAPTAPAEKRPLPPRLRALLGLVALFTLGNASDGFLVLRASDLGVPTRWLPLAWGALSLLRALAAAPGGRVADRFGRGRALALGWALYAVAYLGFGLATTPWVALAALLVYGAYYGLTEGTERALVAELAPASDMGRAFGAFNLASGLLALPASLMFGALYRPDAPARAFGVAAAFAASAAAGALAWSRRER